VPRKKGYIVENKPIKKMKNLKLFEEMPADNIPVGKPEDSMSSGPLKPDPAAVKMMNELIKNVQSGFCVPVWMSGHRTRVSCKDNTYFEINQYRRFGS
jgi:hypothetical protein